MSRFVLNGFTITAIILTILTLISVSVLSYTIYVYFGVSKAMRVITYNANFTVSEGNTSNTSIKTILTIQNPSQFDFFVTFINQKFYLDSTVTGDYNGYWVDTHGGSLRLNASSSLSVVLDAVNMSIGEEQVANLYAVFSMGLISPLPGTLSLRFVQTLQNNM